MKYMHHLSTLLIAATVACTLGCAALEANRPPEGSDEAIAGAVMDRLSYDDMTSTGSYSVRVEQGVATLQGSVASEAMRLRAVGVAQGTPGVTEVRNELRRR